MTVYLARHGETVWNAEGRYQGRLDSPLTDTGRGQARATAETMRGRGVERLLCSPLGRARETGRVVERVLGLAAEIDGDLAESDIGRWEGLTRAEVEAASPASWPGARRTACTTGRRAANRWPTCSCGRARWPAGWTGAPR